MGYNNAQHDRMLGNVIQIGRIKDVDAAQGLVTVDLDGPVTGWIPWIQKRSGDDKEWSVPSAGEQVAIAAPSGELSAAFVIGSLSSDSNPNAGDSADKPRTVYSDGTVVEYDKASHTMTIDTSASSGTVIIKCNTATIQADTSVTIDTPDTTCTGNLTVAKSLTMGGGGGTANFTGNVAFQGGSITHEGKNIGATHTHTGVQTGGGSTGQVS